MSVLEGGGRGWVECECASEVVCGSECSMVKHGALMVSEAMIGCVGLCWVRACGG